MLTRIQTVYVPADDVATVATFYEAAFATPPKFRDGDRWVQFGIGFAIASREEAAEGSQAAVTVFEADDPSDHYRIIAAGAQALEARDMRSHGRTRTYRDPAGHLIQLFWKA